MDSLYSIARLDVQAIAIDLLQLDENCLHIRIWIDCLDQFAHPIGILKPVAIHPTAMAKYAQISNASFWVQQIQRLHDLIEVGHQSHHLLCKFSLSSVFRSRAFCSKRSDFTSRELRS